MEERVVALTGASSGIGRAIAVRFARAGARLVLADVREQEGSHVAAWIEKEGGEAAFVRADVGRAEDNDRLIEACLDLHGRVDVLVANAGITLARSLPNSTDEDIDRVLSVNLKGPMYAARAALSPMLRQGSGNILFVASKTGLVAQRDSPVYCASKGGVVLLARALALDYARQGIRVNALCPGIVDTPMLREFADAMPDPDAAWSEYEGAQPMGRLATPEECAEAALWLVSDQASFVTGVALPVDGGFTAM